MTRDERRGVGPGHDRGSQPEATFEWRSRLGWAAVVVAVAVSGCGGTRCPDGSYRSGSSCVARSRDAGPRVDAGMLDAGTLDADLDGSVDGSVDGGDGGGTDAGDGGDGGGTDAGDGGDGCGPCGAARPICDRVRLECVECTGEDSSACGAGACDLSTGSCAGRAATLCEPCTRDGACAAGLVCVVEAEGDGGRCVYREDAPAPGPAGSCPGGGRPFTARRVTESVDGAVATVCLLARSSCEGWLGHGTALCELDEDCGLDAVEDTRCVDIDPGPAEVRRCTMRCITDLDCPHGSTCDRTIAVCTT